MAFPDGSGIGVLESLLCSFLGRPKIRAKDNPPSTWTRICVRTDGAKHLLRQGHASMQMGRVRTDKANVDINGAMCTRGQEVHLHGKLTTWISHKHYSP
jgi:hypothetical protein